MSDLFAGIDGPGSAPAEGASREAGSKPARGSAPPPLAEAMRPGSIEEVVGQAEALTGGAPLAAMLARGRLSSILLWGPPGCGKTSIARALASAFDRPFLALSAVLSGVGDLRAAFEKARIYARDGRPPLLFIDEIHRYNRAQQDGLLAEVEKGVVILIGATTENPSFALNAALLSRLTTIGLAPLEAEALDALLARAEARLGDALRLTPGARAELIRHADGDGRKLLNAAEVLAARPANEAIDEATLGERLQARLLRYDRAGDQHYDLISALHKSVRGSDPDAALYWFARMLEGGEDPRYLARRLVRMASEDVGLAQPEALAHSLAAAQAFERLGSPEGDLALAQAVVALAVAPKSNAVYEAYKAARRAAAEHGSLPPPAAITNAPTAWMKTQGRGEGYVYDHDAPDRFSGQNYFPAAMSRERYYAPTEEGAEAAIGRRLERLAALRAERSDEEGS